MRIFLSSFLEFLITLVLFLIIPFFVFFDVIFLKNDLAETGFLENYQVFLIFLIIAFSFYKAKVHKEDVGLNYLIIGFFSVIFVRELDWLFDEIAINLWKYIAGVIIVSCLFLFYKNRNGFMQSIDNFILSRSYYHFLIGLVIVLFFSRIFGTKHLWTPIVNSESLKITKNIIQESLEALGYCIIFLSYIPLLKRK